MNIKLKEKGIFFLLFCCFVIVFFVIVDKVTYSDDVNSNNTKIRVEKSREELQELVISTALSYYYNQYYSDYEQYSMEDVLEKPFNFTSFNWRNVNNSPEMVNRTNEYNIDCSSFVLMTYLNSLNYDMSGQIANFDQNGSYRKFNLEYDANDSTMKKFNETFGFKRYYYGPDYAKNVDIYKESYLNYGRGFSTALSSVCDKVSGHNGKTKDEYLNNKITNTSEVVYHYLVGLKVDENEKLVYDYTTEELNEVRETVRKNIINTLQPGDFLVYRRKRINPDNNGEYKRTGHAILYVGDVINSNDKGFIHATGNDYDSDSDPIDLGEDDYSVRYDTWDDMFESQIFIDSKTIVSYEFSILRPINTYCESGSNICSVELDSNVIARDELSRLGIEQYQSNNEEVENEADISNYNSVNNGDEIKYNLELRNMSVFGYCQEGAPSYANEIDCTENKYEWKTTEQEEITYRDLEVVAKVPTGTEYVGCSNKCKVSSDGVSITWNLSDIGPYDVVNLSYTVKVNSDDDIVNPGMEIITSNGNILKLGKLSTKVNPTLNQKVNKDIFNGYVNKFKNFVSSGDIKYNTNASLSSFKIDLDDSELMGKELGAFGFIKSIYYNSLEFDLSFLTFFNIKNAIFNKASDVAVFAKKTDDSLTTLTDDNMKKINRMLVKGMYGGRRLKGNDNLDRARLLKTSYLEYGDIIVTYDRSDASLSNVYLFLGFDSDGGSVFAEFNNSASYGTKVFVYDSNATYGKTGDRIFREIYAKGLFVVLRPTQLYGTTINYDYNSGKCDVDTYVAYNKYQNLVTPTKDNFVVEFEYGGVNTNPQKLTSTNTFGGWYADKELTKIIENGSHLVKTDTHTIYAKWKTSEIELPSPKKTGYIFGGWYSDSSFKNRVGFGGDDYIPTDDVKLYARWIDENSESSIEFKDDISIDMDNKYVKYLSIGMGVEELLEKVIVTNAGVRIENKNGDIKDKSSLLVTGDELVIYNGLDIIERYLISVVGDSSGDGKLSTLDLAQFRKHLVKWVNPTTGIVFGLEGVYEEAFDLNQDGRISVTDLAIMRKKIVGLI